MGTNDLITIAWLVGKLIVDAAVLVYIINRFSGRL